MPEDTQGQGAQGTQNDSSGNGVQGSQTQGQGAQSDDDDDDDGFDKERALRTIKRQRESENALKAQIAELKKQANNGQQSASETEQLRKQVQELQDSLNEQSRKATQANVRSAITDAAAEMGFRNPRLAYRLIDEDDIEIEDGEPQNLTRLLKKVLKADPYLANGNGGGDGGQGNGSRNRPSQKTDMNSMIRQMAGYE